MKVSLITVCFNSASTVRDTVESVVAQSHSEIEYIVVDGASTDSTLEVLGDYRASISKLVSERDNGIYDAMNKGIGLATGEVIGMINSDDFYASRDTIAKVARVLEDESLDGCYGDLCYVGQENTSRIKRYWRAGCYRRGAFAHAWCPPHPTFFVRRRVYQRLGRFDLQYKIAADTELMMRFLEVGGISIAYIPEVLVNMRLGGTTNRSLRNIVDQNREIVVALNQHGLKVSPVSFLARKVLSRGRQFLMRPPVL
jgi:glycosyltransferase involved in cell wall biosynthesis